MQHKTYILSLSKHSQIKVYAIIVINGFCRLKLVKDHPVGDLPAGLPGQESPLKYPFFGICTGGSEPREKYFQKKWG
jgi:hypothetical protein